jgi:intracellular sulfur oxidation DsrE/DsrF family protein
MSFLQNALHRRSFLGLGGTAALAASAVGGTQVLEAQSTARRWQPERHIEDDWLDMLSGKHRMVFDASMPDGFGYALLYAGNYFIANADAYKLNDSDLAVVIVARHYATPFAFNDAMWKKYGARISELSNFLDPRSKQAPTTNLYNIANIGLSNKGSTVDGLIKRGAQFAVCEMAARGLADSLATAGSDGNTVFEEIRRNLISNSRLVPAGIVAVNRAQERGYTCVGT